MEDLNQIRQEVLSRIRNANALKELEELRILYLGRKGLLAGLFATVPERPQEERPNFGKALNDLKVLVVEELQERRSSLEKQALAARPIDVTLPGLSVHCGQYHVLTQTIEAMKSIFMRLGFSIATGPEVEEEFFNFDALNIPPGHPARSPADNFYIRDDVLLRSQTSTVQGRIMKAQKPPIRIICPGRVYRPDKVDASHLFMFHQVEGLAVDENVSFRDLKAVLDFFVREFFGEDIRMRFRPHYFPFTEPSVEVDITCLICHGQGCPVCKRKGWLEILGAGMVNPNVFEAVGYDPEKYTGFAFGIGIERPTMLKYRIDDIRYFFENDIRFLSQF